MKNIVLYNNQLMQLVYPKSLKGSYERILDFNSGYISALLNNGLINKKEFNKLKRVFVDETTTIMDFMIDKKGNLVKYL